MVIETLAIRLTPIQAMRAKCLECCSGSAKEVKLCPIPDCALYPYRFGTNPNRKGIGNPNNLYKEKNTHPTGEKRKPNEKAG
jgi:hypothetical protein